MKIRMLMENTACRAELAAEHGLSLLIETAGKTILFDAGQTGAFADNARRMGVDLSGVDVMILSHGHYDHGGGLMRFLELNGHAPVYVNRNAFGGFYSGTEKYIGLAAELKDSGRLVLTDDFCALGDGMELCTCNGLPAPYPPSGQGLTRLTEGGHVPDDFRHEQYLMIRENGRRVLFSGCSHKGILNIMSWLKPDVLVGGFHFKKLDPEGEGREALEEAAKRLRAYPAAYYTCHCTGEEQFEFLKERMGPQLRYLRVGEEVTLQTESDKERGCRISRQPRRQSGEKIEITERRRSSLP